VRSGDDCREGSVWNLSLFGLYLAIDAPLPPVGQELDLTFTLEGDELSIICVAKVAWQNPPSAIIRGLGSVALGLPPGCGLMFVTLDPRDRARIDLRLKQCSDVR
jgi:hypothetical protein